jgi:uncharacterized repeat protein (TIGR02543 family)
MNKKVTMLCGSTLGAAALLIGLIALGGNGEGGIHLAMGTGTDYSISFDKTTNKIGTEAYSISAAHTGSGVAMTGLGNSIGFDYNSFYNPTTVWQIIKGGGYFTNTDPIHGMKSITIAKNSTAASLQVYWSETTVFDETKSSTYDSTSAQTFTCDFGGFSPNYLKVVALGASNSSIKTASIVFSCTNLYPTLTVTANHSEMGAVSGGGVYKIGSTASVTAAANKGYQFVGWYHGGALLSNEASYSFPMPECVNDYAIEGRFLADSYNVVLTSEDTTRGSVGGAGSYDCGSSVSIEATPEQGYSFAGWYNGTTLVSAENPYSFTMPYSDLSYVAKFSVNSYQVTLGGDVTKGSFSGGGTYSYKQSVSLSATANTGYSFVGWYDGEALVSSSNPYSFAMPYNDLNYTAKFSANNYKVTLSSSEVVGTATPVGSCDVSGDGTYSYGQSATITATPASGYGFLGWYDGATLVSSENPYTFDIPAKDVSYTAKYSKKYQVTLASTDESKGTVSGDGEYSYSSNVTVTGSPIAPQNCVTWYDADLNVVSSSPSCVYTFVMPESDVSLTADFAKITLGSSFQFGRYPQTVVEDSATLAALDTATDSDSDGYLECGSDEYKKVTGAHCGSGYKSASGNVTFALGTTYYFRVEPIEWRVLSGKGSTTGLVMSEKVLTNSCYYPNYDTNRTISGSTVYPNNYQYSTLRAMLNGYDGSAYSVGNFTGKGFLDAAFTEDEKTYIATAEVDNSARTTGFSNNSYACANTSDKIFALSYQDLLNASYSFDAYSNNYDTARRGVLTDYARATGAYMSTDSSYYGNGEWWSRSPSADHSGHARDVYSGGYLHYDGVYSVGRGVRPSFIVNIG